MSLEYYDMSKAARCTEVGKALWAKKLSQETCLLRNREPTGDRLVFVRN